MLQNLDDSFKAFDKIVNVKDICTCKDGGER